MIDIITRIQNNILDFNIANNTPKKITLGYIEMEELRKHTLYNTMYEVNIVCGLNIIVKGVNTYFKMES